MFYRDTMAFRLIVSAALSFARNYANLIFSLRRYRNNGWFMLVRRMLAHLYPNGSQN